MTNEEAVKMLKLIRRTVFLGNQNFFDALDMAIEALKAQDKGLNEWCTDCKEYDAEMHRCPRFNRVIRTALQDAMQDTVSRRDAIDAIIKNSYPVRYDFGFTSIENGMTVTGIKQALSQLPSAEPEQLHLQKEQAYMRGWEDGRKDLMDQMPSAEPEIIRCKDCKWFNDSGCAICIVDDSDRPKENDFCSFAERRTDETD